MGTVHSLESPHLALLRERLGAAEQARDDLIAFARGHSGAVASIHRSVLAILEAGGRPLADIVIHDWPHILGIDAASLVIVRGERAALASAAGSHPVDPALVRKTLGADAPLVMRSVGRGHAMFGAVAKDIRAEALIRFDTPGGAWGVLLLGQKDALPVDPRRGAELLLFLGRTLGAMIDAWPIPTSD